MKKALPIITITTLIVWGVVFLYFYTTGRIEKHLDPSFRIYALLSGIGFLLLGSFNFINRNRALGACTHDHAHGDACDHEHHHDQAVDDHDHAACDHDHSTDQDHHHHDTESHHHEEEEEEATAHDHSHHEDTTSSIIFSVIVLLIPLLFATGYSKDQFSNQYLAKWGKIERQMMQMRIAKIRAAEIEESPGSVDPNKNPYTSDAVGSENGNEAPKPGAADTPPDPSQDTATTEADADAGNDSWATFTLEDLKQMVPQNEAGDFQLDVPQIFYTAGDKELMAVMEGISIETTAQLMEETLSNPNGHRLKAFRLFIECCAADARPLSIPVDFGKPPPEYTEMGWYRIYGNLHYVHEDGDLLPILRIDRFEEASEPMDGLIF